MRCRGKTTVLFEKSCYVSLLLLRSTFYLKLQTNMASLTEKPQAAALDAEQLKGL